MKFHLILDPAAEETVVATVHKASVLTDDIEALVRRHTVTDRLSVFADGEQILLPFDRIEALTVMDGKTYAVDDSGKRLRVKLRLCEAETLLPRTFIRINKSTIANIRRLSRFQPTFSGGMDAIFQSGYSDYVSRRCMADLKRRLSS